MQNGTKRIKIFEYLKNKIFSNGVIFLQETHSCTGDEKQWSDEFKGHLYFSHGKTNSCGVAISYYGSKSFNLLNHFTDKSGCIIIIEASIDDFIFAPN